MKRKMVVIFIGDNLVDILDYIDKIIKSERLQEVGLTCKPLSVYLDTNLPSFEKRFKNIDIHVISNDLFLYFCEQTKILIFNEEQASDTNEKYFYGFSIPDNLNSDVDFYVCGFTSTNYRLVKYMIRRIEFFFGKRSCMLIQLSDDPLFKPDNHFNYLDFIKSIKQKNDIED